MRERSLDAGAQHPAPARTARARCRKAGIAIRRGVDVAVPPSGACFAVEQCAGVGHEPPEARCECAERRRIGKAIGADVEARVGEAGFGAVKIGPARVRFEAYECLAELPIVTRLGPGDRTRRPNGGAIDRWAKWIRDIGEFQRAAEMSTDIEAAPIVLRIGRRLLCVCGGNACGQRQNGSANCIPSAVSHPVPRHRDRTAS